MVLPPVAGGTALLFALGRRGFVGPKLDEWFGITLPFTTTGAISRGNFRFTTLFCSCNRSINKRP